MEAGETVKLSISSHYLINLLVLKLKKAFLALSLKLKNSRQRLEVETTVEMQN